MTHDMADLSMLELFRSETQTHAEVLCSGLGDLADGSSPEKIEPLIRAASSIRGAARIVGLDLARDIAEAIDAALTTVKNSEKAERNLIKYIESANSLLTGLAGVKAEEMGAWLEQRSERIQKICADIFEAQKDSEQSAANFDKPEPVQPDEIATQNKEHRDSASKIKPEIELEIKPEIAPEITPESKTEIEPETKPGIKAAFKPESKPESKPETKPETKPESKPETRTQKIRPANDPSELSPSLADMSMLDLFRMEAETNSQALSAGLIELEKDQSPEKVEPLMRAAHSMKGAARIVGLTDAVGLAHAMEDLLVTCQNGETRLTSDQIDLLLAATDVYAELSTTDAGKIESLLCSFRDRMEKIQNGLRGPASEVYKYLDRQDSQGGAPEDDTANGQSPADGCKNQNPSGPEPQSSAEDDPTLKASFAVTPEEISISSSSQKSTAQNSAAANEAVVRVSAGNLNRLMALAGESMVEAGRLEHFASSLQRIKVGLREVMQRLDFSCERVENGETPKMVIAEIKQVGLECRRLLAEHISEFDLYQRRLDNVSGRLYHEVVSSRMRPFSDGGKGFPRLVRDLARQLDKRIDFVMEGENTPVDRDILDRFESPLNHLIRNAVDHGIEMPADRLAAGKPETGTIKLSAGHRAGMLFIEVRDDGKGMDPEKIRETVIARDLVHGRMAAELTRSELMEFLFLPGFSTAGEVTEISGRGVGLDVVHAMVQEVGGTVRAESQPGKGMVFSMQLPLTLSVIRTLLVQISGEPYAIPLSRISRIAMVNTDEIELSEDRQYVRLGESNVGLVPASRILGIPGPLQYNDGFKVVVISDRMNRYGLIVDEFLGEQDLVVRPLDQRLGKVPDVSAVSLMPDGSPVLILDAEDMVRSIDNLLSGGRLSKIRSEKKGKAPELKVLVVDDSLTVREVERKLLANNGYDVDTAVDGMDGLNALVSGKYDLVVTDVDMPRMSGIELVRRIKDDVSLKHIPVMMVSYKDREEDRLRGLEAGADYYLTKSSFHDETLLSAVKDLIGGGE